jgi:type I restriction enzyme M protein
MALGRPFVGATAFAAATAAGRVVRSYHFATPPRAARLVAGILDPRPGMEIYDPGAGEGRLLFAAEDAAGGPVALWGQERDAVSAFLLRAKARARGSSLRVARGDTMRAPAFLDGAGLRRFDAAIANPMWEQELTQAVYRKDPHGRFPFGVPPEENADWGWLQHTLSALKDHGRMAMILDREVTRRGAPHTAEGAIRARFVDEGLVEAVLTCSGPFAQPLRPRGAVLRAVLRETSLWLVSRRPRHDGAVLFVDGTALLDGYARGELSADDGLERVLALCRAREPAPGVSAVASREEIAAAGYDLFPGRWVRG